MIILNKSAKAIIFGHIMLVPETPKDIDMTRDELVGTYPALNEMLDDGTLAIISHEQAEAAVDTLNAKTVEQLKAYAAEHGIDIGTVTKKSDIIAVIEAARG